MGLPVKEGVNKSIAPANGVDFADSLSCISLSICQTWPAGKFRFLMTQINRQFKFAEGLSGPIC